MTNIRNRTFVLTVQNELLAILLLLSLLKAQELTFGGCVDRYTVTSADDAFTYDIVFKDLACPRQQARHQQPFWRNLLTRPKFIVQTKPINNSDLYTLNITWDETSPVPREQLFWFKAKFHPLYEVCHDTQRCVSVQILPRPSSTEYQPYRSFTVSMTCLRIPPGVKGSLEIIPLGFGKQQEVADFNSRCTCDDQKAKVFTRGCNLDLFLPFVDFVTRYHVIVSKLNQDDIIADISKTRDANKIVLPFSVPIPGNYNVQISFWCHSGSHGEECQTLIIPTSTASDCDTNTANVKQQRKEGPFSVSIWSTVLVVATVILLVFAVIITVYCFIRQERLKCRSHLEASVSYSDGHPDASASYSSRHPDASASYSGIHPDASASYSSRHPDASVSYSGRHPDASASYSSRHPDASASYSGSHPDAGASYSGRHTDSIASYSDTHQMHAPLIPVDTQKQEPLIPIDTQMQAPLLFR